MYLHRASRRSGVISTFVFNYKHETVTMLIKKFELVPEGPRVRLAPLKQKKRRCAT